MNYVFTEELVHYDFMSGLFWNHLYLRGQVLGTYQTDIGLTLAII